ncbi:MAG: glycosyltransferase family 4 protein [Eubacteriales bacterium]|nr:glycosyltransferase family 4 protein [Eubacteriales bacterium]
MRILSITAQKPHSTGSGVFLTELVRGFSALSQEQAVLAGITEEDTVSFPEEVRFYPVHFMTPALPYAITGMSDEMPYRSTRYRDLSPEMLRQFEAVFSEAVLKADREFQPELIICHHLYLLTALVRRLLPGRRIIGLCHGSDLRQLRKNPLMREEIIDGIRGLDCIYALHEAQRKDIIGLFGLKPETVRTLGTGYNSGIFHRMSEEELQQEMQPAGQKNPSEQDLRDDEIRLLFAGKISEKKGVFSLIRALSKLPDGRKYRLMLAGGHGSTEEYESIRALAEKAPYPVGFPGRLNQEALAREMNLADIFVLPSFYEGLPLVLIEALACGMELICTDLPGIRPWMDENVPNHRGIFVTPPEMEHEDEPTAETLPLFEAALAEAIGQKASELSATGRTERKKRSGTELENALSGISWEGLCRKILNS